MLAMPSDTHCRWAESTGEAIKGYTLRSGTTLINYQEPWDDRHPELIGQGYATQRARDYPDKGTGLAFGWAPATRVSHFSLCPGNILTETRAGDGTIGYGREICATCSQYRRDRAEGAGGHGIEFNREQQHCKASSADGVNVLCGICPGQGGHFGVSVDNVESTHPDDLYDAMVYGFAWSLLPLATIFLTYIASVTVLP